MSLQKGGSSAGVSEDFEHHQASKFAFNLFGQAVAFFKSITVLIDVHQPTEAMPALRALVVLAARFEQMNTTTGPGLGIAVRMFRDAAESIPLNPGVEMEAVSTGIDSVITQVQERGITVPDVLAEPQTTYVYASPGAEMTMAQVINDAPYAAAAWHSQGLDAEHERFAVAVEPGYFTDLIAGAAAIAMLELLKHAIALFGWVTEMSKVVDLLEKARVLNDVAAQGPSRAWKVSTLREN
uniref:hypothetical protein n=1 Tax=Paractinoplanes polyasparticus TaxID=2856853 RepID=UPI001C8585B6|nr:hypothetical protein [Actinoplanes polyasparticus]